MAMASDASQASIGSIQIDPQLLLDSGLQAASTHSTPVNTAVNALSGRKSASARNLDLSPQKDASGNIIAAPDDYENQLLPVKTKKPLQDECDKLGLTYPKSASCERLRCILRDHWFPLSARSGRAVRRSKNNVSALPLPDCPDSAAGFAPLLQPFELAPPPSNWHPPSAAPTSVNSLEDLEEAELVRQFDVEGAAGHEVLGFDDDVDEDYNNEEADGFDDDDSGGMPLDLNSPGAFRAFQTRIRVEAAKRSEGNRRAGGIRTQNAMVRAWKEFVEKYKENSSIKDDILDEHSLLLFIKFSAERPKRTRRGVDILGTFLGASQLKKLFFGALHIRKEQDTADPKLVSHRRATSVVVWDAIKNRMDEALERVRNGLIPNEDAPDIVANTFLAEVTEEELEKVGKAFLGHRELRCAINGHLAWTAQHASGNRGDDLRALKLCELQPWTWLHPNHETPVYTILGLQGEEKAGKRGMKTTINPSYTSLIAHRIPEKCPLGALAFLLHYLYDVRDLSATEKIDWEINNTWRQIRLLHSSKSGTSVYSDQSLYNLYVKAFFTAGLDSRLKLHLARHILGYLQERLGVDGRETAKLGWKRGETYSDVYSPSLPKTAILACHGYKEHEVYDPIWRHVQVPETFQRLVCPMAEQVLDKVRGGKNLRGTTGHWEMVVALRPYLFQCGAAIFKICPESPIFRLPALANQDVRNWMATTFPNDLAILQANAGDPVDLQRLQDRTLQLALEEVRSVQINQAMTIQKMSTLLERRTAVLSPTKGFSQDSYYRSTLSTQATLPPLFNVDAAPSFPLQITTGDCCMPEDSAGLDDTGVYKAPDSTYRAFVSNSPKTPTIARPKTQVDLVLPPLAAFQEPDPSRPQLLWPPILGQQDVKWADVFRLVKQPKELWARWKPSRTLDTYGTVQAVWDLFDEGEPVYSGEVKTGKNPPLRLVEKYFGSKWRPGSKARKEWERFREIPDWIDVQSAEKGVSPSAIIEELEQVRVQGKKRMGLNALKNHLKQLREDMKESSRGSSVPSSSLSHPSSPSRSLAPSRSSSPMPDAIEGTKKRRSKPLDPRPRPKLRKIA